MKTEIEKFIDSGEFQKVKKFSNKKETPFLLISISKIAQNYDRLIELMPNAKIYFAVKACPINEVIQMLAEKGSCFDIASIYELDQVLSLGVPPKKISFGNTIKKTKDIEYAYEKGVRLYTTDSIADVKKLAKKAPGSKVFMRILCEGGNADWPLSKKFGAHPDMIYSIAQKIQKLGLIPFGISFHVGSQQRDIGQWDNAIAQTKYLFDSLLEKGIELEAINMGGGFPANYVHPTLSLDVYAEEITRFLNEDFEEKMPKIVLEPGRSLVAEAGIIVTEVVMVSKKSSFAHESWVFLDTGKFNGLIETLNESIKYPIYVDSKKHKNTKEVILAGPTCDSMDILYEDYKYSFPDTIKEGDRVYILNTGAYTASYCSVCFNGFPPLRYYLID